MNTSKQLAYIRLSLALFMVSIFLSGLTAIPVAPELRFLLGFVSETSDLYMWLNKVLTAYVHVDHSYPFLLYGYDWLAFAHFILAILFIGPYRDPIKNIWVIQFGLISCLLVFPLAFIAGHFRGIPLGWRLIDCSFGIIGAIPLLFAHSKTKQLIARH